MPLLASAFELPFADATFDVIFCTEVLEHVPDPHLAVREIARVLVPGGKVFITVPSVASERVLGTLHRRWREYNGHLRALPVSEVSSWITASGLENYAIRRLGFEWAGFWLPHATLQTPFDVTGLPAKHHLVSRAYWKMWRSLDKVGVGRYLRRKGNLVFPKSTAFYARKPL
jgi:SAM-dependent methyltransferase